MSKTKISDRELFFLLHADLPRQGPGSEASTRRALTQLSLPRQPSVVDIGCGPGMQTLHLASALPQAAIKAIDLQPAFLKALASRLAENTSPARAEVSTVLGDMAQMPFKDDSFDLIWCEGAAYIMGVECALAAWRPLLRPRAYLAFTEVTWLQAPHRVTHEWWAARYPDIRAREDWLPVIEQAGYEVVDHFPLPEADWWHHYYTPLEARIEQLSPAYPDHPVLAEAKSEIDLYRRHSQDYSYTFYVLRNVGCA